MEIKIKKLINYLNNGNVIFFISIIWILTLFLSWSLRPVLLTGLSFSGTFIGDYWAISSQASWLPLIAEVSRGNLFPVDPFLGQGDSAFRFFPYISLWLSGLLIFIFGMGGTLLIGSTIIPTCSYIFMVLIYRCFLNWRWSLSLSALGILGFNYAPFREFLFGILTGKDWVNLGADALPGAIGFPFPEISLLSFLMAFYFSIQRGYMSKRRSIILSIAWALQSQIHIVNLIFGIPFWVCFLALKIWRSKKNHWPYDSSKELFMHIVIISAICLPMVISIWSQFNNGLGLDYLAGPVENVNSIDWFFLITYCIFPLVVLRIAYEVFRVDPYELLIKFLPVWIAMSVELSLFIAWQVFNIGIPSELLLSRLGLFFLHIFYFTPAIYCMHRSTVNYSVGSESLILSFRIRSFFIWFFRDASSVYLPIIVISLTVFFLTSAEKSYQKFKDLGLQNHQKSELIFNLMTSEAKPGEVLIGPDNLTNLLLPVKGQFGGIWTNRIISQISIEEVLERFSTYAKVIGWTEKEFLTFMLPGSRSFNHSGVIHDISGNKPVPGLGYWLTFHNNSLDMKELTDLSGQLTRIYNSINYLEKLKEYEVKRIILNGESSDDFKKISKKVGIYTIIDLD
jgi:hypothetical protein